MITGKESVKLLERLTRVGYHILTLVRRASLIYNGVIYLQFISSTSTRALSLMHT